MILVTKPSLPPKEKYEQYLAGIWDRQYLTNNGPLLRLLEQRLQDYLQVDGINIVSNGTTALQLAIRALDLKGEIITTPFSFVATTSSIVWQGCRPVFADIKPETLNIDPEKIEEFITPHTTAILATHVYGNPCDVEAIADLANRHGLKVIYDAAHAFGTLFKGESIYRWGDISITSFHATKLFHTIEGGALFASDRELTSRIQRMRNFGHNGTGGFDGVGINGKNSEFHAAMGLCNLDSFDNLLETRKRQHLFYYNQLNDLNLRFPETLDEVDWNRAYFPVIFDSENRCLQVKKGLERFQIQTRRYFYPSLNRLDYVDRQKAEISCNLAPRILCLPLYDELTLKDQMMITGIIRKILEKRPSQLPKQRSSAAGSISSCGLRVHVQSNGSLTN